MGKLKLKSPSQKTRHRLLLILFGMVVLGILFLWGLEKGLARNLRYRWYRTFNYLALCREIDQEINNILYDLGVPDVNISDKVTICSNNIQNWEFIEKKVHLPTNVVLVVANLNLTRAIEKCGAHIIEAEEFQSWDGNMDNLIDMEQEFESDNGDGGDGDGGNSGIKSKLKILNADSASDVVGPITQIPYIKKVSASLTKLGSIFDQMKSGSAYPMLNGKEGRWIKAKEQDVFVARNQSIKQALLEQCGCAKIGATETTLDWKKMDKKKANYHKADSVKNCRNCKFFNIYRDSCEVVEGFIEPFYISDLWQPKDK